MKVLIFEDSELMYPYYRMQETSFEVTVVAYARNLIMESMAPASIRMAP